MRRPFVPAGWQIKEVLAPLFGEVMFDRERQRYVRRYRMLYLFVGRKNGKTELLAGMVLYLLCADAEEGGEIYGLALDREQAGQVYRVAARMVELSKVLRDRLTVLRYVDRIVDEQSASFYAVLAGDAPGALGLNPHGAYIDELLTQSSRDLYDALRTAMGTRAQPLLLLATTAENDPTGFAATEREWSERVAQDPTLDPGRLVVMHRAPADCALDDRKAWREANPALGDFLMYRALEDELREATGNPAAEASFRQFRLNQPRSPRSRAIMTATWERSDAERGDVEGRQCWGGLDLASTSDLAAYALVFPPDDDVGPYDVIYRTFCPRSRLEDLSRRTGGGALSWEAAGWLVATEGDVIDYHAIRLALMDDAERFAIQEIGYDRWGMTQLSQDLSDDGLTLVQMGQGFATMSGPAKEFLRLVTQGRWRAGLNPCARWQALNLVVRTDPAGNIKPDKDKSADKIDAMVAGVMGLARTLTRPRRRPTYEAVSF